MPAHSGGAQRRPGSPPAVAADATEPGMSAVPAAVVRARRTTGVILLASSLAAIIAVVVAVGTWLTAPPVVARSRPARTAPPAGARPPQACRPHPAPPHRSVRARPTRGPPQRRRRDRRGRPGRLLGAAARLQSRGPRPHGPHLGRAGDPRRSRAVARLQRRLLWSADFATFTSEDYWVTVVPSQAGSTARRCSPGATTNRAAGRTATPSGSAPPPSTPGTTPGHRP